MSNKKNFFIYDDEETKELIELIKSVCEAALVPILWGKPGIGKTALIYALAAENNLPLHILIPSTMDPADVNGLPAIVHRKIVDPTDPEQFIEYVVTENTLQSWAEDLIRQGEGILFFDEASTATPAVQASLLSVLQGRLVSGQRLSDKIWMIAAANDAEDAADGWELAPPLANRFFHVDFELNKKAWKAGMLVNFNKDCNDDEELLARNIAERTRIVAFLDSPLGSDYIYDMPDNKAEAGKAWPSPRTWDNLGSALANVKSGNQRVRARLILGAVGSRAGNEFMTFSDSLNLPETAAVVADPSAFDWANFTPSDVYIILRSVLNEMTSENVAKSIEVFGYVTDNFPLLSDISIGQSIDLIKRVRVVAGPAGFRLLSSLLQGMTGELAAAHLDD